MATEEKSQRSKTKVDKLYYTVVGVLLVVLTVLLVYIFWPESSPMTSQNDHSEQIAKESRKHSQTQTDSSQSKEGNETKEKQRTRKKEDDHSELDEEYNVQEGAPIDESYVPDYSDGSPDMNAVIEASKQVTGLGDEMIALWIGNNGPGKIEATVSNNDQTEKYKVYLQYGNDQWHVTSYQRED